MVRGAVRVTTGVLVGAALAAAGACGGPPSPSATPERSSPGHVTVDVRPWREVELGGARATGPLVPDGGRGVLVPADRSGAKGCVAAVWGGRFRGCLEDRGTEPKPIGRPMVSSGGNVITAETGKAAPRVWVGGEWGDGGSTTLGSVADDARVTDGGASDDDQALFGSVVTPGCPGGALAVWMPLADDWRIRGGEDACVAKDSRAEVVGSVRDGAVLVSGPDVDGRSQAWLVSTDTGSWDDASWQRVPLLPGLERVTDLEYTYTTTFAGTRGGKAVLALDGGPAAAVAGELVDPARPRVLIADDGFVASPVVALQGREGPRVCRLDGSWACVDGPPGVLTAADVSESSVYLTVQGSTEGTAQDTEPDAESQVWHAGLAELFHD